MKNVTVVGAGLTGCTIARNLAEAGYSVSVLEKRPHVAGNAYDHEIMGIRVHKYGPHIFHTKNKRVYDFLSRFTEWVPYEHRVTARLRSSRHVPFPPNTETLKHVPEDRLIDTFYRPYTELMWARPLENVAPGILNRVPIRKDAEDRYFPDDLYQGMPKNGYTEMACRILDHSNIKVYLNHDVRQDELDTSLRDHHVFYSGSIDEYFSFKAGSLPYRSIEFKTEVMKTTGFYQPSTVVNYTEGRDRTRTTEWKRFPNSFCPDSYSVVTTEYPCDYLQNGMQRFYPVRDVESLKTYETYKKMAEAEGGVTFVGRCGSFVYIDMDQAVNQGLQHSERFIMGDS